MKAITQFINEAKKYFTLTDDDRNELTEIIGCIVMLIHGDNEYKDDYEYVVKELTPEEIVQLNDLYDCLSDDDTYPKINRNIIIDDIPLIKKIFKILDNNDNLNIGSGLIENIYEY